MHPTKQKIYGVAFNNYRYLWLAVSLWVIFPLHAITHQLSVCAIFQNEAPYLKEWIVFHQLVGIEHFYLYNHGSIDHYKEVLQPYVASGCLEWVEVSEAATTIDQFNALQVRCYNDCLARSRGVSQWVAFLDVDEYLMPMQTISLIPVLNEFKEFGGVCVNWLMFGTSGIKKLAPHQLLTERLIRCSSSCYPANMHVKSIVQPHYTSHFENPHHAIFLKNYYQVNTDKIPFEGRFSPYIRTNRLRINHYWTKDEDFFYKVKIPRQKQWGGTPHVAHLLQQLNAQQDLHISRFVPSLKKILHSK